jgi:5-formyltetrahydrofolate cyclo-ligase
VNRDADSLDSKKTLRKIIQDRRDLIPFITRNKNSKNAIKKFLTGPYYITSKNIFIYFPFRSELDTLPIIKRAIKDGKKIILPKVSGKNLNLYFVNNCAKQLEKGKYGIMEPVSSKCDPADISDIDLAIIPGVCFDHNFNRLGYGGGYYDKLLHLLPAKVKKIAICFELQVINNVPVFDHDIKVDEIITESNIYTRE